MTWPQWTGRPPRSGRPAPGRRACRRRWSIMLSSRFSMWMAWGPRADVLLQRRLPARHARPQVPVGAGPACQRGVGGDLGRHRPADRHRADHGEGDLGRGPAAVPRAERLPRGDLPHVLLQSAARRRGAVVGMLCVVSEETERVIGERRMATLRDLGSDPRVVRTEQEMLDFAGRQLDRNRQDLPFTLTYLFDDDGGAPPGWRRAPASQPGTRPPRPRLRSAIRTRCGPSRRCCGAGPRWSGLDASAFTGLPTGVWERAARPGADRTAGPAWAAPPYGFLVPA